MYKICRKIHLWLSIPFGLIIIVISLTGMILLFEPSHAQGEDRSDFFLNVMRLHRWLLDVPAQKGAMTVGKLIVAISVIAMILIMVTGIIMWVVRIRNSSHLTASLKIYFHKGRHTFWSSLHTAGGMYVAIFLLLMALTGLTWSFGWYREWINAIFGIEKGSHIIYEIHTGKCGEPFATIIWFFSTLIGATLPLTGYYLWLSRICKRK